MTREDGFAVTELDDGTTVWWLRADERRLLELLGLERIEDAMGAEL